MKHLHYRLQWRQRDSNPRPNKEPICFLHAYLGLNFRAMARPKPPTIALSAVISFLHRSLQQPVPIFPHRLTHSASGRWLGAMSRFSTLCRNQANLLYFDYAARATVLLPVIMANPINERCSCSACLHTCSTCCQNQISPYVCYMVDIRCLCCLWDIRLFILLLYICFFCSLESDAKYCS